MRRHTVIASYRSPGHRAGEIWRLPAGDGGQHTSICLAHASEVSHPKPTGFVLAGSLTAAWQHLAAIRRRVTAPMPRLRVHAPTEERSSYEIFRRCHAPPAVKGGPLTSLRSQTLRLPAADPGAG